MEELEALAREPEVVAIGETGLDDYWREENAPLHVQERFLRRHIRLAKAVGKPLVLHHRAPGSASRSCSRRRPADAGGTFHCFAGDLALARRVVRMDSGSEWELFHVQEEPAARILRDLGVRDVVLETDSPFLAPVPHRGRRTSRRTSR